MAVAAAAPDRRGRLEDWSRLCIAANRAAPRLARIDQANDDPDWNPRAAQK